jgi:hypothetical protein
MRTPEERAAPHHSSAVAKQSAERDKEMSESRGSTKSLSPCFRVTGEEGVRSRQTSEQSTRDPPQLLKLPPTDSGSRIPNKPSERYTYPNATDVVDEIRDALVPINTLLWSSRGIRRDGRSRGNNPARGGNSSNPVRQRHRFSSPR